MRSKVLASAVPTWAVMSNPCRNSSTVVACSSTCLRRASPWYISARRRSSSSSRGRSNSGHFGDRGQIAQRIGGQLDHVDHRQFGSNRGPFDRIVVDEHQRVQADVERLGDLAQVVGLGVPIGANGGEVLPLEQHLGMRVERVEHGLLVVLARHGQQEAALAQAEQGRLKVLEHVARIVVAELDALAARRPPARRPTACCPGPAPRTWPAVATTPATARASCRASGGMFSELTRAASHVPQLGIAPALRTPAGHGAGIVEHVDAGNLRQVASQLSIAIGHQVHQSVRVAGVEQIARVRRRRGKIGDQNRRTVLCPGRLRQSHDPRRESRPTGACVAATPIAACSCARCRSTSSNRSAIHSTSGFCRQRVESSSSTNCSSWPKGANQGRTGQPNRWHLDDHERTQQFGGERRNHGQRGRACATRGLDLASPFQVFGRFGRSIRSSCHLRAAIRFCGPAPSPRVMWTVSLRWSNGSSRAVTFFDAAKMKFDGP